MPRCPGRRSAGTSRSTSRTPRSCAPSSFRPSFRRRNSRWPSPPAGKNPGRPDPRGGSSGRTGGGNRVARKGKTSGHGAALKQIAIHEATVRLAREGRSVVRLKSGDSLVFGRGGEEAEHLAREGVEFEIVPGITAAIGCAAAARVPPTPRGVSSSVTFIAGHEAFGKEGGAVEWDRLPKDGTLAVYMGVSRVEAIARELGNAGFAPNTPFAVVENGTRPAQRVLRGILANLAHTANEQAIRSPAVLFVGRSVDAGPYENGQEMTDGLFAQG